MTYSFAILSTCEKQMSKICKKNRVLGFALEKKMAEILEDPLSYKPLKHDLAGEFRVHVTKSFVLKFGVNQTIQKVTFLSFEHHDEAYRR